MIETKSGHYNTVPIMTFTHNVSARTDLFITSSAFPKPRVGRVRPKGPHGSIEQAGPHFKGHVDHVRKLHVTQLGPLDLD